MLKYIFGNATAERVLLHIYHYGSIHAAAIASDYGLAVTPILNQLERFEKSGILVAIAKNVDLSKLSKWGKSKGNDASVKRVKVKNQCNVINQKIG
ncbi:MAG: hypothetical protein LBU89_00335 [Fibromonadaceae bacterium]|jgi:DNA-binding Lrp family transcriptional regulator|nr:hypothetical protein [Fibromonadaceae bacterium]